MLAQVHDRICVCGNSAAGRAFHHSTLTSSFPMTPNIIVTQTTEYPSTERAGPRHKIVVAAKTVGSQPPYHVYRIRKVSPFSTDCLIETPPLTHEVFHAGSHVESQLSELLDCRPHDSRLSVSFSIDALAKRSYIIIVRENSGRIHRARARTRVTCCGCTTINDKTYQLLLFQLAFSQLHNFHL